MLQEIYKIATSGKSADAFVKKILNVSKLPSENKDKVEYKGKKKYDNVQGSKD